MFPPLHEIGTNMCENMLSWGQKRKEDIRNDPKISDKDDEIKKLAERLDKFKEKMMFVNGLRTMVENSPKKTISGQANFSIESK